MIGNKIKFLLYQDPITKERFASFEEREGLVVDAFTKVSGSVSGKTEVAFGFGDGHTHGKTESERMYKVEFKYASYSTNKLYLDIYAWQLKEVLQYAHTPHQELNEEKILN